MQSTRIVTAYGWARRTFEIPARMQGQRVLLAFERLAEEAVIYVNGERRGTTRDEKVRIQFTTPEQRALIQVLKPRFKPVFQYWMFDEVPEKKIFKLELD